MARGELNGSFANESTWPCEMDLLAKVSLVKKLCRGRTVGNPEVKICPMLSADSPVTRASPDSIHLGVTSAQRVSFRLARYPGGACDRFSRGDLREFLPFMSLVRMRQSGLQALSELSAALVPQSAYNLPLCHRQSTISDLLLQCNPKVISWRVGVSWASESGRTIGPLHRSDLYLSGRSRCGPQ